MHEVQLLGDRLQVMQVDAQLTQVVPDTTRFGVLHSTQVWIPFVVYRYFPGKQVRHLTGLLMSHVRQDGSHVMHVVDLRDAPGLQLLQLSELGP